MEVQIHGIDSIDVYTKSLPDLKIQSDEIAVILGQDGEDGSGWDMTMHLTKHNAFKLLDELTKSVKEKWL